MNYYSVQFHFAFQASEKFIIEKVMDDSESNYYYNSSEDDEDDDIAVPLKK